MHADNETPCLSLWQGSATAVKVCFYRTLILLHVILLKCGIVAGQQMTKVNRFFVVKVFTYKKSKKMLFETRWMSRQTKKNIQHAPVLCSIRETTPEERPHLIGHFWSCFRSSAWTVEVQWCWIVLSFLLQRDSGWNENDPLNIYPVIRTLQRQFSSFGLIRHRDFHGSLHECNTFLSLLH